MAGCIFHTLPLYVVIGINLDNRLQGVAHEVAYIAVGAIALLVEALGEETRLEMSGAPDIAELYPWTRGIEGHRGDAKDSGNVRSAAVILVRQSVTHGDEPEASVSAPVSPDTPTAVVSVGQSPRPFLSTVDQAEFDVATILAEPEVHVALNRPARQVASHVWEALLEPTSANHLVLVGAVASRLGRGLEDSRSALERAEFRLRTQQRSLERQERRVRQLRAQAQDASVLRRRHERLETEHERVMSRRSVRAALRLAELFRPIFRLLRRQTSLPSLRATWVRMRRRRRSALRSVRSVPSVAEGGARIDDGYFHQLLGPLVEDPGVSGDFLRTWRRSESELRADLISGPGDWGRVAIIMPTYNRAGLIVDAIRSVVEQSYPDWELHVCDDGSTDETAAVVAAFGDPRIHCHLLDHAGAAAARNHGLRVSTAPLVAYLDSDNVWHPAFLERMVGVLWGHPGRHAAYSTYVDVNIVDDVPKLKKAQALPFDYERLSEKNFIDLNTYVHRRGLAEAYGGFNESLTRQQDWDLVLRHTFHHEPLYVDRLLLLYRRNEEWGQITREKRGDTRPPDIIRAAVDGYYEDGLEDAAPMSSSLSILSWDVCRNHFSKAYNLAEALDDPERAELIGFRFFDEAIFGPYASAEPDFPFEVFEGGPFPEWSSELARSVARVRGDILYAVKPRLPSLGVALLANYHFGTPVVLEMNDLESVVQRPQRGQAAVTMGLDEVDPADTRLLDPHGSLWTAIMESIALEVPFRATHNANLDEHFGGGAFRMRNPKDDRHFDPARYDRAQVRAELGFDVGDRVLLFGGMVREHKGVFDLADLVSRVGPEYRLLVVGSRETPDQQRLREMVGDRVTILEHVDRNEMAAVNLAADAVVLRLDPEVPASHYQMPYKLTDALAMRVPVVANDISDLGDLGRRGYLRLVPFGDDDALIDALHDLEEHPEERERMVDAGRRLYLREFSYRATRAALARMSEVVAPQRGVLPIAERFAEFFAQFREAQHGTSGIPS